MTLVKARYNSVWQRRHEFHVLTYAEEGFAPLTEHTKDAGISKKTLIAFAETVNRMNQPGSLYPKASVSAVPRPLLRDQKDSLALCLSIGDFYQTNASHIRAKKVLLDFRTPDVEPFVQHAIEMSLRFADAALIDELIVVDDNAM